MSGPADLVGHLLSRRALDLASPRAAEGVSKRTSDLLEKLRALGVPGERARDYAINAEHGDVRLGRAGARCLARALESGNLGACVELRLAGNALGDAGAAAIGPALPRLAALDLLRAEHNDIGEAGGLALVRGLADARYLHALHLCGNPRLGDAPVVALAALVAPDWRLRALHLSDVGLGDAGAAALASVPQLRLAVLSRNRIRTLPPALVRLPALERLVVAGNPLRRPPVAVCGRGLGSMLQYWRHEEYRWPVVLCSLALAGGGLTGGGLGVGGLAGFVRGAPSRVVRLVVGYL